MDHPLKNLPPLVAALFDEEVTTSSSRAYLSDLKHFFEWCEFHEETPIPCTQTALVHFLTEQAEAYTLATIERRASAVAWAHRKSGFLGAENPRQAPLVQEAIRLLRRRHRDRKKKQAKELNTELIREVLLRCKADKNEAIGLRDRAMILLGFAGAFRRSELVALDVSDIDFVIEGMEIMVRWSKTDQAGKGMQKKIARGQVPLTCPGVALRDWLQLSKINQGSVFRKVSRSGTIGQAPLSDRAFYDIIKKRMLEIGVENWNDFSAHSVRSGFASTAAANGAPLQSIKGQGGWKSDSVALGYIRSREDWANAASYKLGL